MIHRPSPRWLRLAGGALLLVTVLASVLVLAAAPGAAQNAPVAAQPAELPAATELDALAATISDEARRNELLATIRGLIEARRGAEAEKQRSLSDRLIAAAEKTAASGQAMLDGIVDEVGGAPGVTEWFARRARDPEAWARLLGQLGALAVILAAAWGAELLIWRLLTGVRLRLTAPEDAGIGRRLPLLLGLAVLDLVPLVGFAAAGYGT
ncbi:MAG: hypothetical protein ACXW3P_08500, partial [Rhodospirillales bacterium]